ncbi:nitrogenase component 1 [Caldicellulosiruptoraceae bacterium PP1]
MHNKELLNLDINPCKMCMPIGASIAFKGIEKSMMILHGSQGCSTYIRRHMATHYNEPIDIASSSITEIKAIYGGEENLKKAISNVIKVYNPKVIGIMTTCLAETIGEDIKKIAKEYSIENKIEDIKLVPISSKGFLGTEFEGYFLALLSLLETILDNQNKQQKNNAINVIVPNMSPADLRNIKSILDSFEIDYILFPDYSETLDAPFSKRYKKISDGGISIDEIKRMTGALATIELSLTVPDRFSPGKYLEDIFSVPLYRIPIPIGIKNTDRFLRLIENITNKKIPEKLNIERGRLIDAMIDAHKINAEGKTAIYGEPEIVYSLVSFCEENGIKPLLAFTGAQNETMRSLIQSISENCIALDNIDFHEAEKFIEQLNINILIGNSNGRLINEKKGIPIVRIGFPIHDRLGAQRLVYTGYNGTMNLLDDVSNTLIEQKHSSYRSRIYSEFYNKPIDIKIDENKDNNKDIHPCFSEKALKNARIHLPVVGSCNIQCNYCNRRYDCVNENRPGVTTELITPKEALQRYKKAKKEIENLSVVGIAGPGDALSDFEKTKETILLIKDYDPDVTICLSTNGLMLPYYIDELKNIGVSHLTVTINTINPYIGKDIYKYVNYFESQYKGIIGSKILINNQLEGIKHLKEKGIKFKINTVVINGINTNCIEDIAKLAKENGAELLNLMPLIPVKGTLFENLTPISKQELNELRKKYSDIIKQMYHCKQCRADAVGLLIEEEGINEKKINNSSINCTCSNGCRNAYG